MAQKKLAFQLILSKKQPRKTLRTPVLGICLGHQTIGAAFGAKIIRANNIMHGKIDKIMLQDKIEIFKGIPTILMRQDIIP